MPGAVQTQVTQALPGRANDRSRPTGSRRGNRGTDEGRDAAKAMAAPSPVFWFPVQWSMLPPCASLSVTPGVQWAPELNAMRATLRGYVDIKWHHFCTPVPLVPLARESVRLAVAKVPYTDTPAKVVGPQDTGGMSRGPPASSELQQAEEPLVSHPPLGTDPGWHPAGQRLPCKHDSILPHWGPPEVAACAIPAAAKMPWLRLQRTHVLCGLGTAGTSDTPSLVAQRTI